MPLPVTVPYQPPILFKFKLLTPLYDLVQGDAPQALFRTSVSGVALTEMSRPKFAFRSSFFKPRRFRKRHPRPHHKSAGLQGRMLLPDCIHSVDAGFHGRQIQTAYSPGTRIPSEAPWARPWAVLGAVSRSSYGTGQTPGRPGRPLSHFTGKRLSSQPTIPGLEPRADQWATRVRGGRRGGDLAVLSPGDSVTAPATQSSG